MVIMHVPVSLVTDTPLTHTHTHTHTVTQRERERERERDRQTNYCNPCARVNDQDLFKHSYKLSVNADGHRPFKVGQFTDSHFSLLMFPRVINPRCTYIRVTVVGLCIYLSVCDHASCYLTCCTQLWILLKMQKKAVQYLLAMVMLDAFCRAKTHQ